MRPSALSTNVVVGPPGILSLTVVARQRRNRSKFALRAGSIACQSRELAQRNSRRLGSRIQRRRVLEAGACPRAVTERHFLAPQKHFCKVKKLASDPVLDGCAQ